LGWFTPVEYHPPAETPDEEYPFVLTTGRTLYHYNVSTFGRSSALSCHQPEERIMINPSDAGSLDIHPNDWVTISSRRGVVRARAWITENVPPGLVWMSFHFPECPTNEVTNDAADQVTRTYEYKVCAVKLEKTPV
jgi:formate dehydrogenase alpha subunit